MKRFLLGLALASSLFLGSPAVFLAPVHAETDIGSTDFKFNLGIITNEDIPTARLERQGINYVFERIVTILAVTVGSAAVLMIAVGGFMILVSGLFPNFLDKGKEIIFKSIMGLLFTLGAYILVTSVQLLIKSIFPA